MRKRKFILPSILMIALGFSYSSFPVDSPNKSAQTKISIEQEITDFSEQGLLSSKTPGPYLSSDTQDSFDSKDKILATYYYYWYDHDTTFHFIDPDQSDALTDHPIKPENISWKKPPWHVKELIDMNKAGISVVLPVYWGDSSQRMTNASNFSQEGLVNLVTAVHSLQLVGQKTPKIGMFYDTSTLQFNSLNKKVDLNTPEGKAWLYTTIRDFYSIVPPNLRAMINGQPIVFFYNSGFADNASGNMEAMNYISHHFAQDFQSLPPYLVTETSWQTSTNAQYSWGSSLTGPKLNNVTAIGPGYDDAGVLGRNRSYRDRKNGEVYKQDWETFLSSEWRNKSQIVAIETWNEYHEGTEICETKEYGREYIDLTRQFSDRWRFSGISR